MNNYFKLCFLILVTISLFWQCTSDVDRCAEKLENGINPKPIVADIDAWIIDQQNSILNFANANGEIMNVHFEANLLDSVDIQCPEVIFEKHRFRYDITDTINITAIELQGRFTAKIRGAGSESFYDISTWIDQYENLSNGGEYFDEVILQGTSYDDVFLVTEYLREVDLVLDSLYFQRGIGLIAFEYQNDQLIRQ